MKQVLSQQEIDSLLNALDTGEIDTADLDDKKDNIKSYDFRRPIKLSKEYMNSLYMVFGNFAKITGNLLASHLNVEVDIELAVIEQVSFDEFIRSIPRTTLLGIFRSKPLTGIQVLEMNPKFCTQVIELVCGGIENSNKGKVSDTKEDFTDIELGILSETVGLVLKAFESSWQDVVEMTTEIDSINTNSQMIQSMSPNEPVVLISFTIKVLGVNSFMNICIPFASFEHILDKLSFRSWFDIENEKTDKAERDMLKDRIVSSSVEILVGLGKSKITVKDFLSLESGDTLQLDTEINDPLKMYVEGKPHFLVRPGLYNGSYGAEVLQYIEEDVD